MNGQRLPLRQRRDLTELIEAAFGLYTQNAWPLFTIAAVVIPLGIASAALQTAVEDSVTVSVVVGVLTLGQALVNLLAGAALIAAFVDIDLQRPPNFSSAYDVAFERFGSLLGGVLRVLGICLALAITIVGIPWAIRQAIRWVFVEQAVVLDGANARDSLTMSSDAVVGSWWRTLGITLIFGVAAAVPVSAVAGIFVLARCHTLPFSQPSPAQNRAPPLSGKPTFS